MDEMVIEYCIFCDNKTQYKWNDNISERNYYVEGAGQLCEKCYNEIYIKKENS